MFRMGDPQKIVDMLVLQAFAIEPTRNKTVLWGCFGDIILENIRLNLEGTVRCQKCGTRFTPSFESNKLCPVCSSISHYAQNKNCQKLWLHTFLWGFGWHTIWHFCQSPTIMWLSKDALRENPKIKLKEKIAWSKLLRKSPKSSAASSRRYISILQTGPWGVCIRWLYASWYGI